MINKQRRTATVAVINENNRVLLLRRGKTAPWMPGKYCLPGGHAESGEDIQYAAVRELSEETGISYPVEELDSITITYSSGYSKLVWIARIVDPKIFLNYEHDSWSWINYDELYSYPLVPRLKSTLQALYRNGYIT